MLAPSGLSSQSFRGPHSDSGTRITRKRSASTNTEGRLCALRTRVHEVAIAQGLTVLGVRVIAAQYSGDHTDILRGVKGCTGMGSEWTVDSSRLARRRVIRLG